MKTKYQTPEEAHEAKLQKMREWRKSHPDYAKQWRLKRKQKAEKENEQLMKPLPPIKLSNVAIPEVEIQICDSPPCEPPPVLKPKSKAKAKSRKIKQNQPEKLETMEEEMPDEMKNEI